MALFMAGTAMADSYFYMDDVAVSPGQQEITLPVKAHFNGRVSAFQLDFTFPQCMTAASIDKGSDLTISYQESDGTTETQRATFMLNEAKTRCMAAFMDAGYHDPDGDGNYEQYGVIKWEAGEYEEMMLITPCDFFAKRYLLAMYSGRFICPAGSRCALRSLSRSRGGTPVRGLCASAWRPCGRALRAGT